MRLTGKRRKFQSPILIMLSLMLVLSNFFTIGLPVSVAADNEPELIVDYEFTEPSEGGLPTDEKGGSTLTSVEDPIEGQDRYGNSSTEYGTDSAGDYLKWTTDKERGGGFTLDIDPVDGKDLDESYSVGVRFSYANFQENWTKIIDYKNKTEDEGFYFDNEKKLKFYDVGDSGSIAVEANQIVDIIATRDDSTKKFIVYMIVDGEFYKEIDLTDDDNGATPIIEDDKLRLGFFHDDYKSQSHERTTEGKVYSIKFWDGAVSPAEALEATAAKGEESGTTKITVTSEADNSFKYVVSDKLLPFPLQGDYVPTDAQDYTSGADIEGVDATENKYVGVYEIDSGGKVVGFKLITLTEDQIKEAITSLDKTPGGVSDGLVSWVDFEESVNRGTVNDSNIVTSMKDLAEERNWTPMDNDRRIQKEDPNSLINFNYGLESYRNSGFGDGQYVTDVFGTDDDAREVFSVQTPATGSNLAIPWEFGGTHVADNTVYTSSNIKTYFSSKDSISADDSNYKMGKVDILNVASTTDKMTLSLSGKELATNNTNEFESASGADSYYIGASHNKRYDGIMSEVFLYDRELTAKERNKVNSYLALKYGITLASDYISSDGTTKMWTVDSNENYGNRITGIGRDDGSVIQKQSKSQVDGANVTIALGEAVEESNSANENTFANDKSFFTFSDNDEDEKFSTTLEENAIPEDLQHEETSTKATMISERVYKVDKTNWKDTNITLHVDDLDSENYDYYVAIHENDADFPSASTNILALKDDAITLSSEKLADGSYFTLIQHVNKTALENRVSELESLTEDDYESGWDNFVQALENAEAVLGDAEKTISEVADALTALNAAYEALEGFLTHPEGNAIETSEDNTSYTEHDTPIQVDKNVTLNAEILNDYKESLTGVTVMIENIQAGDKLQFEDTEKIVGTYNQATGVLTLTPADGQDPSIEDYQTAMQSVEFTTTSKSQEDRNITFGLGTAFAFDDNGHFYDFISKSSALTWHAAKAETETKSYFGRQGYLATITSEEENSFIADKTSAIGWIGAADADRIDYDTPGKDNGKKDGDWRWVTGPEGLDNDGKGTPFYKGYANDTPPGSVVEGGYANWKSGEPNNSSGEWVAHIYTDGDWNDFKPTTSVTGYVIEYGGMPGDATFAIKDTKTIEMNYNKPELESAEIVQTVTDGNTVTLTFDQDVEFNEDADKGKGFTIKVGDKEVTLNNDAFSIDPEDPTKVIITLPEDTDVSGQGVNVSYNEEGGNLQSKTTGAPVGDFDEKAIDPFAEALKIQKPGSTVATSKPEISGQAEAGSEVSIVIKDKNGNEVTDTGGQVTADENGNWTFTPTTNLPDGTYTVEVTATKDGKTATKTKKFTVNTSVKVPYTEKDKVSGISPDSIKYLDGNFIIPNDFAQDTFTFKDGDQTMTATKDADGNWTIEKVDPSVIAILTEPKGNTVATNKPTFKGTATPGSTVTVKVSDDITLTATADTNGNWSVTTESNLPDGKYNIEVTAEKDGVTSAIDRKTLTIASIDKTQLEARVAMADDLTESDFTVDTWADYTSALSNAKNVLNDPDATQDEVDKAYTALKNAQDALKFQEDDAEVDKSALQDKVTDVGNLNKDDYTAKSWADLIDKKSAAKTVLDNDDATQAEVDQALEDLIVAENALIKIGGLNTLTPSTGTLSPSFTNDVYNYFMNVGNGTSQLTFTPEAIHDGAKITMTANGVLVTDGNIPLNVGSNTIVIKVEDESGTKSYTITVYRAGASSGGGGGTTPTPTPDETTETIDVDLEIDGDNPLEKTTVTIKRTKKSDGTVHDEVQLTKDNTDEAIAKAKEINNNIARIILPDVEDIVDTVTVTVPKESIKALRENGLSLEVATEHAIISLDNEHMAGIDDDFYFYVVPVKTESERQAIEERARVEQVVREAMKSDDIDVVARPMTIETNLSSRPVTITLPLKDVDLPTDENERQTYLEELGIFIEHTDGEKVVVFPEIVEMKDGMYGLQFTVEKFSTFTIIHFGTDDEQTDDDYHGSYINGFSKDQFGPDENVTRIQMARMMARILGYSGEEHATYSPFKDIPKEHSGSGAIAFMKEQGIFNGDENDNFRPWDPVSRAHMAVLAANYKKLDIKQDVPITFDDTKNNWARWAIEADREANIIRGYGDGTFRPNVNLSRQHAVLILNRMFERGPLHGVKDLNFHDVPRSHVYFNDIAEAAISHHYIIDEDGKEKFVK